MANAEHLALLKGGRKSWNAWRQKYPDTKPDLDGATLRWANLSTTDLSGASLRKETFNEANLSGASLRKANLSEATLREANLSGADLSGADLSGTNLRAANLITADLSKSDLSRADLSRANFGGATLSEANLSAATLIETNLSRATLDVANLSKANLSGAKLLWADLSRANLRWADLSGADLTESRLGWTVFVDNDLSTVKGLETISHYGPSGIGIDTIYKSGGKISEIFLRGAGVPDNFITYIGSLVGKPIEFYSCFISYSTADQDFADRLYADLQNKNVRCWFAPHHIAGGKKIYEQIDEAIRLHDKLLLILSSASMQSEWVKTEIAKARKREIKEGKRILFPISIVPFDTICDWENFDADTGKDSAREIREYFIPDFSRWKDHDSYQKTLDRLVKDLKAETVRA